MATSARLNTYQLKVFPPISIWNRAKSTTAPCRKRSMPLPTAPPMIRPSASVASERAGARHPDPQHDHGNRLDRHQGYLGELIIGLEPAKADPDVPGQHQVEERRDPDRAALGEVEHVEQPELRGLVDHQRRDRGNDAGAEVRGSRAFEARHLSGLLFLLFRPWSPAASFPASWSSFSCLPSWPPSLQPPSWSPSLPKRPFWIWQPSWPWLSWLRLSWLRLSSGLLGFGLSWLWPSWQWASWLRLQWPSRLRQPSWPLRPSWP